MTLYRKYRPQKIEELDLLDLQKRLSLVLSSGHIPHAFLFSGPKGTGKTSTARIIAKVVNCEKVGKKLLGVAGADRFKIKFEPCNTCESCMSITNGSNMDVMEIDAASNRGIDEMRDLREKIKLAPTSSLFKVYIIDEVHMLTTEAFNALLKTLEEPPPHAIFILATTEPDKLLPTIISRCTKFDFKKASVEEIIHSLKRVVKGEGIAVSDRVLYKIAEVADGSFRDGTKLLEQAISENALEFGTISTIIGTADRTSVEKIIEYMIKKDAKGALELVDNLSIKGVNMRILTSSILAFLHDVLLAKHGLKEVSMNGMEKLTKGEINNLIKLFLRVYTEFRNSSIAELPLEIAVVEWCEREAKS